MFHSRFDIALPGAFVDISMSFDYLFPRIAFINDRSQLSSCSRRESLTGPRKFEARPGRPTRTKPNRPVQLAVHEILLAEATAFPIGKSLNDVPGLAAVHMLHCTTRPRERGAPLT